MSYSFKTDIGMPSCGGQSAFITQLMCEAATFLLLLTADDTDLITKFTAFLRQRVDVEP